MIPRVPDGEGKDTVEPFRRPGTPPQIGPQKDLGVRVGCKVFAQRFQLISQIFGIVELPIVGNGTWPDGHGLLAVFRVDHAQPPVQQRTARVGKQTLLIRPPALHAAQYLPIKMLRPRRKALQPDLTCNSAHKIPPETCLFQTMNQEG